MGSALDGDQMVPASVAEASELDPPELELPELELPELELPELELPELELPELELPELELELLEASELDAPESTKPPALRSEDEQALHEIAPNTSSESLASLACIRSSSPIRAQILRRHPYQPTRRPRFTGHHPRASRWPSGARLAR
jgi:hypothetical protein